MKAKIIKKLILSLSLTIGMIYQSHGQQNIQFSQYVFNSLSVNPAYAGYKEEWFAQLAFRSQWSGFSGAPKTGQVSVDGVTNADTRRVGLGLQLTSDKVGAQSSTSLYANYAYRLRLNAEDTERLSFGIAAGITQYGLDYAMLDPVNSGDPNVSSDVVNSMIPDLRFGVYYYNPKWYIGASVIDLISSTKANNIFKWDTNPQESLERKRHLYLMTGALLNLSDGVKLRPSILAKEDFAGPTSLDLNVMTIFNERFWIGASYRTGVTLWKKDYSEGQNLSNVNAISGITQFYITDKFRIGYSYDYSLSDLNNVENGSHEITLGLTFPSKGGRLLSPRFF